MTAEIPMPAYPAMLTDGDIRVTPAAASKLAEIMSAADAELRVIRLFVAGGGCGGMGYGMTFAEAPGVGDSVFEGEGFRLAVDAVALNYLRGCEIDFSHDRFMFSNVFQSVGGSGTCGGCGGGGCGA